ncbi:hypothetical protein GCM10017783_22110 [Deinococcus piscis]|uniref:Copper amine oxidase-like N-terminal domain-containing protein n=1 Tax=Deinococcus piscis TaxID=394230 RepID=A0ABQ3K9Q9_9DEIO|nr:hypothetical protein [Deinococcus piscis]GHG09076.1 hypothetical protein GCM10017783_22110 [Deinococcus piscis]
MTPTVLRAGLLGPAFLSLCALLPGAAAQSSGQTSDQTPTQQVAPAPASARLVLPAPGLSRLAVELSGAVGGRLYRCPPSLGLPAQAICLYVRGERADLQSRIAARLGSQVLGEWQVQGPLLSVQLRPAALLAGAEAPPTTSNYVALLDLGDGDHLLMLHPGPVAVPVLSQPQGAAASSASSAAAPVTPADVSLYVTPADLIGVVRVQNLGGQTYRLTPQGGAAASVQVGQRELVQAGTVTPLPLPLQMHSGELHIPVAVLRAIGCVLTPTEEVLTVACGRSSVGVMPRRL